MEEKIEEILRKVKIPSFEDSNHKRRLKAFLLEKYPLEEERYKRIFLWKRRIFALSSLIAVFLLSFYLLFPQYNIALAKRVAQKDPEIKQLVSQGANFNDVRIADHKAFLVISPPEEIIIPSQLPEIPVKTEGGIINEKKFPVLVEIDLKKKKVLAKEEVFPQDIVSQDDLRIARKIIEENKEIPVSLQRGEVRINIPASQIKLEKKGNKFEPVIYPRKLEVFYQIPPAQWRGEIDLENKKVVNIRLINK